MRLISDFHDYYDGAIHYSNEPVYIRKQEEIKDEFKHPSIERCLIIGFCGQIYKFINPYQCADWFNQKQYTEFIKNKPTKYYRGKYFWKEVDDYFKHPVPNYGVVFSCLNGYYFDGIVKDWKVTLNCRLRDYKFYKIYDTYSAAQEIEMYLNNLAIPEKPIPKISDKIMAEAKGFDKYSFRKDKKCL